MKTTPASEAPFYIGWQTEAPSEIARRVRAFIIALAVAVVALAGLLVWNQSGFATSTFELGRLSTLEGTLRMTPVPVLQVAMGQMPDGNPLIKEILLVSPGKFGAGKAVQAYEQQHGATLNGKQVTVSGTLIYHDGKTVFELTRLADSFLSVKEEAPPLPEEPRQSLGRVALAGEIADPKCLLGVMKPGWGKPHRSCAARCLAGGIPPMLRVQTTGGQNNYYLLLGLDDRPINDQILSLTARPVLACGQLERWGEWMVLRVDPAGDLMPLPASFQTGDMPMCRK